MIVAINNNSFAVNQSFSIQGADDFVVHPRCQPILAGNCAESVVSVSAGSFTYSMPAYSIVTFVDTGSTGNPLANPDFSGNTNGWTEQIYSGPSTEAYNESPGGWQGNASDLAMNNTSNSYSVNEYQIFSGLTPNNPFTASFYVTDGPNTNKAEMVVQDGPPSWANLCQVNIPANVTAWTSYTCSGLVDATGTLQFVLRSGTEPASGWIRWQFASLTVGTP